VSESSLGFDRAEQVRIDARAGIPVYRVDDIVDGPVVLDGPAVGAIPVADLVP
jgi:hypothetical protein